MLNESQILVLKEYNGNLQVETIPVEDSSFIINEINNTVDNPNKTLMDVQSRFLNKSQPIRDYYGYLYPWTYSSSYISGAFKPKEYTYDEYKKELNDVVKEKMRGKDENERSKILSSAMQEIKEVYASSCKRYIKQQALDNAFQKASSNPRVMMYSRECIGWSNFEYKITDDVKVNVYTNFGYGFSSFFTLTISYKDIIIAPYSYIAKYYKANMTEIIRCTRDYYVKRDSWNPLFEFVKDFANQSRYNPAAFVEKYLMNEIDEMMNGLRNIMNHTGSIIKMFVNQSHNLGGYHHLKFISPMSSDEKRLFEVFPHEMPIVFKCEKFSQATKMLAQLRKLSDVYSKIDNYIDEILTMMKNIKPEVENTIAGIQDDIMSLENKRESTENKRLLMENRLEPLKNELVVMLEELPKDSSCQDKSAMREKYYKEHPDYATLKDQIQELDNELRDIKNKIQSRNALLYRLTSNISVIDKCIEPAA